jgi:hypothetical protein
MLRSQDKDALMASWCLSDELTCVEIISTFGVSVQDKQEEASGQSIFIQKITHVARSSFSCLTIYALFGKHPAIMLIKISKDTHTRKLMKGEKYLF